MEKIDNKKIHGKTIIMHLKRHHKKYFCGIFGGFALVKMALLFFGISPVLNIGNIFADSEDPITLTADYLITNCPQDGDGNIFCTGKNIGSIEPGIFSGLDIDTLDLSYNKLSSLDFEIFSGSTINTLNIRNNQIYRISNPEIISGTDIKIGYNCLPSNVITEMQTTDGNTDQLACFYVEYQPATWTKSNVKATLSVTGNNNIVDNILSHVMPLPSTIFSNSGFGEINFENKFLSYSGDILNYPEDKTKFPAYVNWIEKTKPTCGTWTFEYGSDYPVNEWYNTGIIATLSDSTDEGGSEILTGGGTCVITGGKNATCTVTISDNAGNTNICESNQSFNIDTQAPTITLDKQSGSTASSHSVTVTITDDMAGLSGGQRIYYKWQTESDCSTNKNEYVSTESLTVDGDLSKTAEISTPSSEGEYYLCIFSGIQDLAGHSSEGIRSSGVFVVGDNGNGNGQGHSSADCGTGPLVQFEQQPFSSWIADADEVRIRWECGSQGGYWYSNNTYPAGSTSEPQGVEVFGFTNPHFVISLTNQDKNNKYICAYAKTGQRIQTICSDHPIKIDSINPEIELLEPGNSVYFESGSLVYLSWSGFDVGSGSGISKYVLTINIPGGGTITYNFDSSKTSTGITVNKAGTWTWSVKAIDGVGKTAEKSRTISVTYVDPNTPPQPPYQQEKLIEFKEEPRSGWARSTRITFGLTGGVIGKFARSNTNDTGVFDCDTMGCNPIPTTLTINIADSSQNGKYICATAYKGNYSQTICSQNKVFVDPYNPEIDLLTPENGADYKLGDIVTFRWSGHDNGQSGISGYIFTLAGPNNTLITKSFGPDVTSTGFTVNKTGTWIWSVKAEDFALNAAEKSGYLYVMDDNNDDTGTGFEIIGPKLFDEITLGNDIRFSWNTSGSTRSGYTWNVERVGGTTISGGTTENNYVVLSNEYFRAGNYSRSVTDVYSDTTKVIPLFYVIREGDTPDLKVDEFEFNEVDDANPDSYRKSNNVTIDGLDDGRYTFARLKDGIGALYINGDFAGVEGLVTNGDKVHIELKASSRYDTTVSAELIVGTGSNLVSGDFKVTTRDGITGWNEEGLTPLQRLWGVLFVDSLIEMYQYDKEKLATFLSTFMQLLKDKSDYYNKEVAEAEFDGDDERATEYKAYKNAIDFLYTIVKYRYDDLDVQDRTVYIAPNGKQYLVEYDEDRMAYTSPDFSRVKYFPTWELFINHINMNNPAKGKWGIVGNVITTHNGKVYTIYETNGKWTSSNFKTAKYFDTKEDIINHILANNPASDWNHTIDTSFDEVSYTAPNGKVYKIFRTSSKGNNPNLYSSYNFVNAKYFTSLEAAKKFIDQNNKK